MPRNQPYSRMMNRRNLLNALRRQSGSQYTDEEFKRRSRTRAGRRNEDNERRGLDALRRESGAQFTDAEFKRRANRRIGGTKIPSRRRGGQ